MQQRHRMITGSANDNPSSGPNTSSTAGSQVCACRPKVAERLDPQFAPKVFAVRKRLCLLTSNAFPSGSSINSYQDFEIVRQPSWFVVSLKKTTVKQKSFSPVPTVSQVSKKKPEACYKMQIFKVFMHSLHHNFRFKVKVKSASLFPKLLQYRVLKQICHVVTFTVKYST